MNSRHVHRTQVALAALILAPIAFLEPQSAGVVFPRQHGERHTESSSMDTTRKHNRLFYEKSPYLRQHAYNPVDWYPWGEEAFERAREEDKPIFLSIGYSTCHWCHVMERESFENEAIAALLNQHFVSIKVDREERPDVDRIYMTALHAMGQNGGWPMSMFLTPELKPFYGGTYFPPESRYGRAGFPDVLRRIHDVWEKENLKVLESANTITGFLEEVSAGSAPAGVPGVDALDHGFKVFTETYDPVFGGFGGGPKFPRPSVFNFLLRYYRRTGNPDALEMTEKSLQKISLGGIYDHIGGGFHRYSVDGEWRVPHFEKMLYDQAQLLNAYVDLYQLIAERFREILGNVIVFTSSFDEESKIFEIRAMAGMGNLITAAIKWLGRNPVGMQFELTSSEENHLRSGKFAKHTRGINELSKGAISKKQPGLL